MLSNPHLLPHSPIVYSFFFFFEWHNILYSFFFLSWRLITLQYCSGFCHTLKWISHGFTCVPHPDSPSHLPIHPIPLGLPSAPGKTSLHLYICVSFAALHIGSSLPSFKIPYTCFNILYLCFSFWLTSLHIIGSSFIHLIRTDSNVLFL